MNSPAQSRITRWVTSIQSTASGELDRPVMAKANEHSQINKIGLQGFS
jgi:hypothetical protein